MSADKAEISVNVTIGFDAIGDPLIHLDIVMPEGGGGLAVDSVEDLALHLLGTVAQARANAMVARKLMLDGAPPEDAISFLRSVMG